MASAQDRFVLSRLVHRLNFGPKPGQFVQLLNGGLGQATTTVLSAPATDPGLTSLPAPALTDLGPFPAPGSATSTAFNRAMYQQFVLVILWWLDRMVLADYPLVERMTWFWHGHWATAISKVQYALPMKLQNDTLRAHALGNFADMSRAMIVDGALIVWLDGELNVAKAPNENLAREFMELFTLGVGNYTENDVKAAAAALTGYRVVHSNGTVTFNPQLHNSSVLTFLATTGQFDATSLSDYVTSLATDASFVAQRLWFRLVSTSTPAPTHLAAGFADRNIASLVQVIATDPGMADPVNSQVKSPVEWFVSACRALVLQPSKLASPSTAINYISAMGQLPFDPPNVGGWPYDDAWLTASATQYRLALAGYLVKYGDVSPVSISGDRVQAAADWLGVAQWSANTATVLAGVQSDPLLLAQLALCAPEYVVNP